MEKLVKRTITDCDMLGRVVHSIVLDLNKKVETSYMYRPDGSYTMEIAEFDLVQDPVQERESDSNVEIPTINLDSTNVEPELFKRKPKPDKYTLSDLVNPLNCSNKTFERYMSALKSVGIVKDYDAENLDRMLYACKNYPLDKSSKDIIFTTRTITDNITRTSSFSNSTISFLISALLKFNIIKSSHKGKTPIYKLNVNVKFFEDSFIKDAFKNLNEIPLMNDFGIKGYINFDSYIKYLGVSKKEGMKLINDRKIEYKYINDTVAISEDSVREYKMKNSIN